ncbi:MAG: hypothetical protein RXO22_07955 [Thermocladium sp.]
MPSINNFEIEYQVNELKDFTEMGVKGAESLALQGGEEVSSIYKGRSTRGWGRFKIKYICRPRNMH